MKTSYDPSLKVHVTRDAKRRVRHVRHSQEYFLSEHDVPRLAAADYLRKMSDALQIPREQLGGLHKKVSFFEPREQGVEYQLHEEKHLFDGVTIGYHQTFLNLPVWRRGLSVKIKQNPTRIVAATNNGEDDLSGKLPDPKAVDRFVRLFKLAAVQKALDGAGLHRGAGTGETGAEDESATFVRETLEMQVTRAAAKAGPAPGKAAPPAAKAEPSGVQTASMHDMHPSPTRILSGKLFVHKFDPAKRYGGKPAPARLDVAKDVGAGGVVAEEHRDVAVPPLPPVSDEIHPGQAYVVAEIIFTSSGPIFGGFVWLALVEVETGSILYMECMTCGVNGLVFRLDPVVRTGDLTITSASTNAVLNPLRDDQLLPALDAPTGTTQTLQGQFVTIQARAETHADPDPGPPSVAVGSDFDFDARTNEFAAVSAYHHQTSLFTTIESLGFPTATYFDGTTFPISVDHRGLGDTINAHWSPNGTGGTGHLCFALCDTTNTTAPLGRAVDPWVHWHEMGGHGTLGDHVGSGNLGFSHSAGDGLAAIQMDPESALRGVPERFRYAPFRPIPVVDGVSIERRFDRDVSEWAWGSQPAFTMPSGVTIRGDDGGYGSEQILATCHFRIYRSIGGDSADLGRRRFASRMTSYLILRTIQNLTSTTNPGDAQTFCEEMQDTDLQNWTSEGLSGGAYNKVIRWAFEKQGAYQLPGAPTPVTTAGAPPEVDVYIDDGRHGEYQYQPVHWHNTSMWNSNTVGGTVHDNAIEGAPNYLYGKLENRGRAAATNVRVRCFHSLPGAGLTWPNDFVEMSPVGGIVVPSVPANDAGEVTVGPFEWEPNINAYGHDCTLMIASVEGDPSNIDNFSPTETIAEWRLVPNDNNIGQRNVTVMPGGETEAFTTALDGAPFFAGNPFNRPAQMEVRVTIPAVLAAKGWGLRIEGDDGGELRLKPGEKRKLTLRVKKGSAFTPDELRAVTDRDVRVDLYGNDMLLGGMTYRLDPDRREVSGGARPKGEHCRGAAQRLLECLELGGDRKVKKVCVKKVSVDLELDSDCDCD